MRNDYYYTFKYGAVAITRSVNRTETDKIHYIISGRNLEIYINDDKKR